MAQIELSRSLSFKPNKKAYLTSRLKYYKLIVRIIIHNSFACVCVFEALFSHRYSYIPHDLSMP